jgi:hypothetical protein
MIRIATSLLLLLFSAVTTAQTKYTGKKLEVIQLLESKKKAFQSSVNDSLYLIENSDKGYAVTKVRRGDQADDIELQLFGTPKGGVAGPFDGETSFYLLKIVAMDSLYRTQAKLVSFFPKGDYVSDTTKFNALVENYIAQIKKGKPFGKMLVKDEASIGLRNKGVISFWENNPSKENFSAVFDKKTNDPVIQRIGKEIQVLYVIEEKTKAPYEAKVLKLVKKVE